ncbi:NO signaling/Golgi transport ligand-binding domain-containing protein [Yarrowia lipolytica]|jgi:hypothetical protein|nr:hypothetical protein YALI1_E27076g [Yarrowia lipolytica]KAB8285968.1 NO signaling/Golgi transport ligand-binding domain-containing protein [Yarrowia lipolytica]KAE8172481.1 NO signaling/Golgi transport ligand-binding domain-containing protein [Yarrowia lipolytica]KAJ8057260.1 NO signaling/Golgi transport ligand-binding domain-containing protein [Yarrowia lipolytica]QNP99993.1 Trafficking protein particle complex subunit 6B [Yarrowia lipolytica]
MATPRQSLSADEGMVSSTALELLLAEVVPAALRVSQELTEPEEGSKMAPFGYLVDSESHLDNVYFRVEGYGYRVGRGIAESFSNERPHFADTLDMMKFICKDVWLLLYNKQVDHLKTNHRGTFVFVENQFRGCQRMSAKGGQVETMKGATPYLWFPVGVIRGVLAALGIQADVTFETTQLPVVYFNIHVVQ